MKVSGRLLNVYVHSDAFSREVIFKNLRFFFGHPLAALLLCQSLSVPDSVTVTSTVAVTATLENNSSVGSKVIACYHLSNIDP